MLEHAHVKQVRSVTRCTDVDVRWLNVRWQIGPAGVKGQGQEPQLFLYPLGHFSLSCTVGQYGWKHAASIWMENYD